MLAVCLFVLGTVTHANAAMQWLASAGGNNHWYEVVSTDDPISWSDSKANAEGSVYLGMNGYFASVTSKAENEFIASLFTSSDWVDNTNNGFIGPWVGGKSLDASGKVDWINGDVSIYTEWEDGQPTNSSRTSNGVTEYQDYVHYFQKYGTNNSLVDVNAITWNDHFEDGNDKVYGYVVEYTSTVPEPTTMLLFGSGLLGLLGFRRKQ
jgi:hypothetical protein